MWKKEDWYAIWLGFFVLLAGMVMYFPQSGAMQTKLMDAEAEYLQAATRTEAFKTIAWYQLYNAKKGVKAKDIPAGKWISTFSKKTHGWASNPRDVFFMSKEKADAKKARAVAKYDQAKATATEALALATAAATLSWFDPHIKAAPTTCSSSTGSSRRFEHGHHLLLHLLGNSHAIMVIFQPLSQQFAGLDSGSQDLGLFGHIRNHLFGDLNPLAVDHERDSHLAGFPVSATVTGSGTLPGYLGHRFDEVVKKKFFQFVRRKTTTGAAHPYGHGQLTPQDVPGLMAKLEPTLK